MARTITEVSANNTFQAWLDKTNELVRLVSTEIVTASSAGDVTPGNVILGGSITANTVIANDKLRVDSISPKAGSSSISADAPINITATQTVLERLTSPDGPRISFFDNIVDWQIGFENSTNKNFVITTGTSTIFRVASNGDVQVSGAITASAVNSNASSASALQTSRSISSTGDVSWTVNFNGSANVSAAATIEPNAVTNAKFRQSAGLSVVGRSSNTTGNIADITAASDHQVMRRSGSSVGFGAIALGESNAVSGQLNVVNGGTGLASLQTSKILVGNGTNQIATPVDLHWDLINSRLGVGTATPTERLDVTGNVRAALFIGTATSANYADLAEKYLPDAEYDAGTVVMVGGEKEVTATQSNEDVAIGVISENPAFMMNQNLEGGIYVALKGRVPVKTVDNIQKGDILVPGPNGQALKGTKTSTNRFAVALSNSENGYVEAVIL